MRGGPIGISLWYVTCDLSYSLSGLYIKEQVTIFSSTSESYQRSFCHPQNIQLCKHKCKILDCYYRQH